MTQPQSVIGWRALPRFDGTVWIFASNYTSSAVNDALTLSGTWGSIVAYADKSDRSDRLICMQPFDHSQWRFIRAIVDKRARLLAFVVPRRTRRDPVSVVGEREEGAAFAPQSKAA